MIPFVTKGEVWTALQKHAAKIGMDAALCQQADGDVVFDSDGQLADLTLCYTGNPWAKKSMEGKSSCKSSAAAEGLEDQLAIHYAVDVPFPSFSTMPRTFLLSTIVKNKRLSLNTVSLVVAALVSHSLYPVFPGMEPSPAIPYFYSLAEMWVKEDRETLLGWPARRKAKVTGVAYQGVIVRRKDRRGKGGGSHSGELSRERLDEEEWASLVKAAMAAGGIKEGVAPSIAIEGDLPDGLHTMKDLLDRGFVRPPRAPILILGRVEIGTRRIGIREEKVYDSAEVPYLLEHTPLYQDPKRLDIEAEEEESEDRDLEKQVARQFGIYKGSKVAILAQRSFGDIGEVISFVKGTTGEGINDVRVKVDVVSRFERWRKRFSSPASAATALCESLKVTSASSAKAAFRSEIRLLAGGQPSGEETKTEGKAPGEGDEAAGDAPETMQSSGRVAQHLGISPLALARISGTVAVSAGAGGIVDIGLDMKYSGRQLYLPGYTKQEESRQEGRGPFWLYSGRAIRVLKAYQVRQDSRTTL